MSSFKSKFASASGASTSKFLAKTPTNPSDNNSNNPSFDSYANEGTNNKNKGSNSNTNTRNNSNTKGNSNKTTNNNNNNINNTNSTNTKNLSNKFTEKTQNESGLISVSSFHTKQDSGIPNTDFNESDGRDIKILGTTHQLPLQYRWTLWHTAPRTKDQGWTDNYKQIASFDTVGTFWQLFNNIAPPSMLRVGSSYHLFKGKVEPMWEDRFNLGGGSWTYRFGDLSGKERGGGKGGRGDRNRRERERDSGNGSNVINYAWYYTVLNMIGNNFNYSDNICGVVISVRKGGRGKIELWIKNANDRKSTESIGYEFKKFSGAQKRSASINFITHEDNKNGRRGNSYDI